MNDQFLANVNSSSCSLYVIDGPSVCLSSVMLVHPTQAISRKRCKIGAKLVLITTRNLHMGFRLVPNSVTLDGLERRNIHIRSVISPNSVAFGANYVKVFGDTPVLSVAEM